MGSHFPNTGVHKFVRLFLDKLDLPQGAKALDCPAGDGRASYLLRQKGAQVAAFDLHPEFFKVEGVECNHADLRDGFPVENETFDFAVCEEGIEHIPDQLKVLQDFNRVLKKGGALLVTTPSLSHYRARLSFLLGENDSFKTLPPNEVDSIWYSIQENKVYYGHIFLMTAQRLRTLAVLAGFTVEKVCWTDIGTTAVLLLPFVYPLSAVFNFLAYWKACRKCKPEEKKILWEVLKLNLNPAVLLSKHHMFYLRKKYNLNETLNYLKRFSR